MTYHIKAILWKQLKDTLKNKAILIQFIMFPIMAIIMEKSINLPDMPEHFFANLFAVMYIGIAPLTSAAAIISEEKEKNTLRVLRMCNVHAAEFLIGNAAYIISICMLGSLVIGCSTGYTGMTLLKFLLVMLVGHICSFLLGAAIGTAVKSQMSATSITVPLMIVLAFLPMLSMFNETIKKFSKFIFSEQLFAYINDLSEIHITLESGIIMICNAVLILIIFLLVYQKGFKISK